MTDPRHERIAAVDFDYRAAEKVGVEACNLCGGGDFVVLAHRDRYGFPAEAHSCRRCGLVFLNPVLTDEAYAVFYREVYRPLVSAYHGRRIDAETVEEEQDGYARALAALLEPFLEGFRGADLLDVGGSTGVVPAHLAERFGLGARVLDPSPAEVERARGRGLEATIGTIERYEAGDDLFGVITLCQTIDHLVDVRGSLAKLRALLRPGGIFFVDIVDFRAAYLRNWSIEEAIKVDHPYSLTEPTAEAFLAGAGFRVVRTSYADDHLHVGYVCEGAAPNSGALPPRQSVARLLREVRFVQSAPAR